MCTQKNVASAWSSQVRIAAQSLPLGLKAWCLNCEDRSEPALPPRALDPNLGPKAGPMTPSLNTCPLTTMGANRPLTGHRHVEGSTRDSNLAAFEGPDISIAYSQHPRSNEVPHAIHSNQGGCLRTKKIPTHHAQHTRTLTHEYVLTRARACAYRHSYTQTRACWVSGSVGRSGGRTGTLRRKQLDKLFVSNRRSIH